MVYDLEAALDEPARLDSYGDVFDMRGLIQAEISGACFAADEVIVSTSAEPNEPEGPDHLAPNILAFWSNTDRQFVWERQLPQTADATLSGWSHDEPQRVSSAGLSSPVSSSLQLRLRMRLELAAMALVVVRAALAIVPPTLPSDSGIRASSGRSVGRSSR